MLNIVLPISAFSFNYCCNLYSFKITKCKDIGLRGSNISIKRLLNTGFLLILPTYHLMKLYLAYFSQGAV